MLPGRRVKALIMAGGQGERFWPLSTPERPKQFIDLTGEGTLIQQAVARVAQVVPYRDIYVATGQSHLELAMAQIPQVPRENFIVEPIGRDTAPCIGLAAVWLEMSEPDALMLVVPADHFIPDQDRFVGCVEIALAYADKTEALVTIGIQPDRPETGYGYIESGEVVAGTEIRHVRRFVEKPDRTRAEAYLSSGGYLWNAGIFAWSVRAIRGEIARHLPDLHARLEEIARLPGRQAMDRELPSLFPQLPKISIDYGVLERSDRVYVVPGDFRWDDLGSWTALARLRTPDADGNIVRGLVMTEDCHNLVVESNGRMVAALGVSDLIVVETDEVVLISSLDRAQEVRRLAIRARGARGEGKAG